VLAALLGAGPAWAQNADAEALFNDGDRLMSAGKIADACDAFEASNRIETRAGTLIRLGECREANHQLASAWSAFKDALTRVRDPRKREIAQAKAAELEPKLSFLTVSVSDEARIDGLQLARNGKPLDPGLWNRAVPVDGGTYIISGRAPGHEEWQTTVVIDNEHGKGSVDVPKFKEIAKLVAPPTPVEAKHDDNDAEIERDGGNAPSMFTRKRKIAIGVAGAGAAAAIAGTVLGLTAKHRQDEAFGLCPDPATPCAGADRATSLLHSGHQLAIEADVAYGVAAGAAIGAGVLWFLGKPQISRHVAIVPTASGFAIAGGF